MKVTKWNFFKKVIKMLMEWALEEKEWNELDWYIYCNILESRKLK